MSYASPLGATFSFRASAPAPTVSFEAGGEVRAPTSTTPLPAPAPAPEATQEGTNWLPWALGGLGLLVLLGGVYAATRKR